MEIGLYGVHSNNMDKLSSELLVKQIRRLVGLYVFVILLTSFLPSRVTREEFTGEENGNATLMVWGSDQKLSIAESK